MDVKRLAHLPLGGAMRLALAVQETLDALIPPHERQAVTVGEGVEAVVLVMLTGEQALSRVAETWAGDDLAVLCRCPLDAAPCHGNRLAGGWMPGGGGLDRIDGAVIRQAIQRDALALARLHPEATSVQRSGA